MFATPRAADIIASVAMNAGTLKIVTRSPTTSPLAAEATSAKMMATASGTHDHHRQGKHRTHRKVDPSDQNDESHANGHDPENGDLVENVEAVSK
jgi:hypothetical protein